MIVTPKDVAWLRQNWTPEHSSFKHWLAGSDRAHRILGAILIEYSNLRWEEVI